MKWFAPSVFTGLVLSLAVTTSGLAQTSKAAPNSETDVSRAVVDTTMRRLPTAVDLGPWEYSRALFLSGELSVYERTHDPRYLQYAKAWADSHMDAKGNVDRPVDALDFIMPGNLFLALYKQTGDQKYEAAAKRLHETLLTYPRTADGAYWHAEGDGREHQLWLDGTYMGLPFLIRQGELSEHPETFEAEAVRQLLLYNEHLRDVKGALFYHAYDETDKAPWVNPATRQSRIKWARAIGWYSMALVDVLDVLPVDNPERPKLITILRKLVKDLDAAQDKKTGLWYQVIDQRALHGNWLETSSSSMFTYAIDVAVKRGYVDASYKAVARKGFEGVLSQVTVNADGSANIRGICEGTNVGDLQYYLDRKSGVDDFHGLGAFLLMNEEVKFDRSTTSIIGIARRKPVSAKAMHPRAKPQEGF